MSEKNDTIIELVQGSDIQNQRFSINPGEVLKFRIITKKNSILGCCSIPGITFETGKSFIRPTVVDHLKVLEDHRKKHPEAKIVIFGHTDKVSDDMFNKKLSERRALSVYAFITNQEDEWEKLYLVENWGMRVIQTILKDFSGPYDPGTVDGIQGQKTTTAIKNYQGDNGLIESGNADLSTRKSMFKKYMSGKHDIILTENDFLSPPCQGCGEFNPLVGTEGASEPNRRVIFFLLSPDKLPSFPCQPEDLSPCREQIAVSTTRTNKLFRCAFYDDISKTCKCEQPINKTSISLLLKTPTGKLLAETPYEFEINGVVKKNTTTSDGSVIEETPEDATEAFLTINSWRMKITLHDLKPPSEIIGAKARLNNLEFYSGDPIDDNNSDEFKDALKRFQTFYTLNVTGVLDEPTQKKLEEMHGS